MFSLFVLKAVFCSITLTINTISSFVTFFYVSSRCNKSSLSSRWQNRIAFANCFSIGLFLSVCFLGLYHSSSVKMRKVQDLLHPAHFLKSYPISEATLCLGLFVLWLLEWTIRANLERISSRYNDETPVLYTVKQSAQPDNSEELIVSDADDQANLLPTMCPTELNVVTSTDLHEGVDRSHRRLNARTLGKTTTNSFLKTIFLSSAMGLHSFLEALGYGLLDSGRQVFAMAFAMTLHQALCSGTLGLRLARATTPSTRRKAILLLVSYLLLLPVGAFIGITIHSSHPVQPLSSNVSVPICSNTSTTNSCLPVQAMPFTSDEHSFVAQIIMALLQNLAAATFLYVVFVEMLPAEINAGMPCASDRPSRSIPEMSANRGVYCCLFALFGFLLIASVHLIPHG